MPLEITGMRLHPNPSGEPRIVANFDIKLQGLIELKGCALVQASLNLEVWGPPVMRRVDDLIYGFKFAPAFRRHVLKAAKRTYDALIITNDQAPELSAAVELIREIEERDAA